MKRKKIRFETLNFEVNVDGAPVEVMAKPYVAANEKQRFRVSYNGSPIHIFGFDEAAHQIKVIDSAAQEIPPRIEQAIAKTLLYKIAA